MPRKEKQISIRIQEIRNYQTEPCGIKVAEEYRSSQGMQCAEAKQADAEKERRAKIIHAEATFQVAQKVADAAEIIAEQPTAMHLKFLQSLVEVSAENNLTIVLSVRSTY